MDITVERLQKSFRKFNKRFFDSILPDIEIKLSKSKNLLGYYEFKNIRGFSGRVIEKQPLKIVISAYYKQTLKQYEETLLHEMIHYYLSVTKSYIRERDPHGIMFRRMMRLINETSEYNVTVCGNASKMKLNDKSKKDYFVMTYVYNGKEYFSRVTKDFKENNASGLSLYDITQYEMYTTSDVKLDRFPERRTRLSMLDISLLNGIKLKKI